MLSCYHSLQKQPKQLFFPKIQLLRTSSFSAQENFPDNNSKKYYKCYIYNHCFNWNPYSAHTVSVTIAAVLSACIAMLKSMMANTSSQAWALGAVIKVPPIIKAEHRFAILPSHRWQARIHHILRHSTSIAVYCGTFSAVTAIIRLHQHLYICISKN